MEEPDNEECFPFWHHCKSTFGKLYLRALSVPASSAAVESVFSRGWIIMRPHKYLPSVTNCCLTFGFCLAIVNLTLIYFQDYRLAFLVINIFGDFMYCIKMMFIMSLNRFSLMIIY